MSNLEKGKIKAIQDFSTGKRVLLDFMSSMGADDYVLVGNTMTGFIPLVSENHESDNYRPRTFRFNTGALHQYVKVGDNQVRYLEELASGDSVIVGQNGVEGELTIGRVKHEIRPFVKVVVTCGEHEISAILQKGETVALLTPNGYKHLDKLEIGEEVYCEIFGKATHLGDVKDEFVFEN